MIGLLKEVVIGENGQAWPDEGWEIIEGSCYNGGYRVDTFD